MPTPPFMNCTTRLIIISKGNSKGISITEAVRRKNQLKTKKQAKTHLKY